MVMRERSGCVHERQGQGVVVRDRSGASRERQDRFYSDRLAGVVVRRGLCSLGPMFWDGLSSWGLWESAYVHWPMFLVPKGRGPMILVPKFRTL